MIIRRSEERGRGQHGWLDARHAFSFNTYYDPQWMEFHGLRVLNEDRIAAAGGFPTHPHHEMEIITYVISGELAHKDSMGNIGYLGAGEMQVMSAGTGLTHSEYNSSDEEELHLLQIWIRPGTPGVEPRYDQRAFPLSERKGGLKLLAAPGGGQGGDGALLINADAEVYGAYLLHSAAAAHEVAQGRAAWVQVVRGTARVNGETLAAGDAAGLGPGSASIEAVDEAEILILDLAATD